MLSLSYRKLHAKVCCQFFIELTLLGSRMSHLLWRLSSCSAFLIDCEYERHLFVDDLRQGKGSWLVRVEFRLKEKEVHTEVQ